MCVCVCVVMQLCCYVHMFIWLIISFVLFLKIHIAKKINTFQLLKVPDIWILSDKYNLTPILHKTHVNMFKHSLFVKL